MRRISQFSILATAVLSTATAMPAAADFKVHQPDAEAGEFAIEPIGNLGYDPLRAHSGEASFVQEFEYGVNGFWLTELELESERAPGPGQSVQFSQVTWENTFQFTERGQYWMDVGFFAEFGKATLPDDPNEFTFGPIFRKEILGTINTVNLFMEKEVGSICFGRPVLPVQLGNPVRVRHTDRARFSGLWPAERVRRLQFALAAGQPYRAATLRHDLAYRSGFAQMERRHPVRLDPGLAAPDHPLAGRIRNPFLTERRLNFRGPE